MESSPQPRVLVIGGPNGAGKSTLAERVLPIAGIRHFVNADTIARGLSMFAPDQVAGQAGRILVERLRSLAEKRADFAFETTLSGKAHARFLRELADAGYQIELVAIWLRSSEESLRRVHQRRAAGGHDVPEADVRRRYSRIAANLFNLYLPLADRWEIFDNSRSSAPYRSVAEGGRGRLAVIRNHEVYDELKSIARGE